MAQGRRAACITSTRGFGIERGTGWRRRNAIVKLIEIRSFSLENPCLSGCFSSAPYLGVKPL